MKQLTGLLVPNRFASSHMPQNKDILIVASGATSRPTPAGRENWLVDAFAKATEGKAAVVQDRAIAARASAAERPAFAATRSLRDAYLRVLVASKLNPLPDESSAHIRKVVRELLRQYQFEVDEALAAVLEGAAVQHARRAPHWTREFERILRRTNPRLVVLDNASYMTKAAIGGAVRRRGIPIAEPQHGWIGPSHAAYNYGRAFFEPALKQYLPDVLLTFGDFWSDGIRHPATAVAIGKPHLEASARLTANATRSKVLLVSSIYRTDELIRVALSLRDALPPEMSVAVRPHPSERPQIPHLYGRLLHEERIDIDTEPDLYSSFAESIAVVGYASTVLFEAVAFDIPVLVIDSPLSDLYAPTDVFGERVSPERSTDIVRRIQQHVEGSPGICERHERIWKSEPVNNFAQFAAPYLT